MNVTLKALFSMSTFLCLSIPISGSLSMSEVRVLGDVLVLLSAPINKPGGPRSEQRAVVRPQPDTSRSATRPPNIPL